MATIFTKIISGEIPSYRVAENEKFIAFLDIGPLAEGHTLVVPRKETDYLFDIEDADLAEMMIFTKRVARALEQVVPCKRIGVAVLGLEVPHAHIHLVPLNREADISFSRERIRMLPEEFEDLAARIAEKFE
ncbi:MAG: HIT family protein [Bacteroidales bacterium]|nr:HIT family protein [Bacteroidales bacterium]